MATAAEKRDLIRKLIKGIDIAMFTTIGEDGFPVSRPLSTQEAEFDGRVLWFFVRRNSAKIGEIERYPRVNVAYASKDRNVYLSVAGTASVVDDQALIDRFWSDALKAYFSGGRTDLQLVLIRVDVATVEYWDGPATTLGKALAFVIARVTRSDDPLGVNRLVRIGRKTPFRTERSATHRRSARKRASPTSTSADRKKAGKTGARRSDTASTVSRKTATRTAARNAQNAAGKAGSAAKPTKRLSRPR